MLPASSFSIMLGLHDRRKTKTEEPSRLPYNSYLYRTNAINFSNLTRKRIKVRKVIVHENFTTSGNDIALLQLGKKNSPSLTQVCPFPEDRVDLSVFSPVCLPSNSANFIGHDGFVFGEQFFSFSDVYLSNFSQVGEKLENIRPQISFKRLWFPLLRAAIVLNAKTTLLTQTRLYAQVALEQDLARCTVYPM